MTKKTALQPVKSDASITTGTDPMRAMEQVLLNGDLAALAPAERLNYYKSVCESIGLNPLTKPFEYIKLNGKLTLYARKDATDQLRKIYGISIAKPDIQMIDDQILVTVCATDASGRSDSDIGVVSKKDMGGSYGNSLMKAVTKAKRRVTLSICGLGMLDESEVDSIPNAQPYSEPDTSGVKISQQAEETTPADGVAAAMQSLADICKELNKHGDATWNRKTLSEFANLVLEDEKPLTKYSADQLLKVYDELSYRLDQLMNSDESEAQDAEVEEAF